MKIHTLTQAVLAISFFAFSINSYASQWYHVELIVFEQLQTVTDEQWPQMPEQEKSTLTPQSISTLLQPTDNETLLNSVASLNRSARYQVHYHSAWQQPIMEKRSAEFIDIHSDNDLIQGKMRLYKSTYLHAALDLWLVENTAQVNSWSDISPEGVNIDMPRNPNLNESRRIRSKKLYFFDHPKLGALLKLTPIETPIAIQESESLETYSLPTEATPTVAE